MPPRLTSSNFSRCPPRARAPGGVFENRLAVGGAREAASVQGRAPECFLRRFFAVSRQFLFETRTRPVLRIAEPIPRPPGMNAMRSLAGMESA